MPEKRLIVVKPDRASFRMTLDEERAELNKVNAELVEAVINNEDDIIAAAKDADAIITTYAPLTRKVFENLPKLLVAVRYGIGYDNIDVEAATDNNVIVVNIPDYCYDEVSNHAIVLLLTCAKKIVQQNNLVKQGRVGEVQQILPPMGAINGQTLGLVGCGHIARVTAKKAQCFGLKTIGYDPYLDKKVAAAAGITLVSLSELLKEADYVSVHALLNAETRHLISEKELRQMKPTAYIINTARGPVIDEAALVKALREKWIAGAGLDVVEKEPVTADNPLTRLDNVIITPHSAYYSDVSSKRLKTSVGQEAARVLSGYWPKNYVNKTVRPKKELKKQNYD
jgi:D-3-phosphoglycerate dehydrogenase / 2-oxoglutarate reductase